MLHDRIPVITLIAMQASPKEIRTQTPHSRSEEALWKFTRFYSRLYGLVKDRTGRNLKGLGFLLRHLNEDRKFNACGYRWFFDHRIGGSYMRLVGGSYNEPETQLFLQYVAGAATRSFHFVDVGANIGEMLVTMASHPNVDRVVGFEPHPICVEVCQANAVLNHQSKLQVLRKLVADGSPQPYVMDASFSPTSGIRRDVHPRELTPSVRLDAELHLVGDCVLLVDVEGAELDVMRSGRTFIAANGPLIIFEYHAETRKHFALADVNDLLGDAYELYRLRTDGFLDRDLTDTWNCVAVDRHSLFAAICAKRVQV